MNLIIDIGNTRVKIGVFSVEMEHFSAVNHANFEDEINFLLKRFPSIKKAIISATGKLNPSWVARLKDKVELHVFSSSSKVPFINRYATPETLGLDRKALVAAAVLDFPQQNTLILDLGTCITYDFVDQDKNYFGGAISPGIKMRFKAMYNFTANLPLIDKDVIEFENLLIGNSTASSMEIGVLKGIINEIKGFVAAYQERFVDLTVILCGGDANLLAGQLKNSIFANSNFQLKGLNHILEQNSVNV